MNYTKEGSTRRFWSIFCILMAVLPLGCVTQRKIAQEFELNRRQGYQRICRADRIEQSLESTEFLAGKVTLRQCLESAMINNKDIQIAKQNLLEAKGRMTEAIATALPELNFFAAALAHDNSGIVDMKESYELQLLARQPLYKGGLVAAAIDAAAVYTYMTQQQLRMAIQNAQLQVRRQYLGVLLSIELEKVAGQAKLDAEEHLADVQKKLEHGVGQKFDLLRARVRLTAAEADRIKRKNQVHLDIAKLLKDIGLSQTSQIEPTGELTFEDIDTTQADCLLTAMLKRSDLLVAESMVRLAKDNLKSERAGNRPEVHLRGVYNRYYPGFGSFLGGYRWERTMNGGIVVEWPLFDGLATAGKVTQAKSNLRQEQLVLSQNEQQAQLEVTEALLNLQSGRSFVLSQSGNVQNAEEALRLAQVRFKEGAGTSLDVISAENALSQARSDYATAVHNFQNTKLQLNWAIGTLGEEPIPQNDQVVTEISEPQGGSDITEIESEKL